jgi:nucleoside-diphosphate-sugar epimerase
MHGVEWVRGSLEDVSALDDLTSGADAVVHLAGAIAEKSLAAYLRTNVAGTASVLDAAQKNSVARFVHVSSLVARQPDISHYAYSKKESERLLQGARTISTLAIRPCAVYGQGDLATLPLIRELMKARAIIPARVENRFSMIHVADLARILVEAAGSEQEGIVEVDDGAGGYQWADLAKITQRHFATPRTMHFLPKILARTVAMASESVSTITGRPPVATRGSIDQLYAGDWVVQKSGWPLKRPIGLEEGLLRTIDGYQNMKLLPKQARVATALHHSNI